MARTAVAAAHHLVHTTRQQDTLARHAARIEWLDALPDQMKTEGAYCQVRDTISEQSGGGVADIDLELATIAAWCAGHGLAEMISFKQFAALKELLGGEDAFLRAVFEHLGMFAKFDRG